MHFFLNDFEEKVMDLDLWTCWSTLGVKSVRKLLLVMRHFLKRSVMVVCLVPGLVVSPCELRKGSNPVSFL